MCDDYISRAGLIALFNKIAEGVGLDTPWDITAIETIIESAPSEAVVSKADYQQALETVEKIRGDAFMRLQEAERAEAELHRADKYGHWIPRHGGEWVDCSECGTMGSPHWKRCPVCEAKMLPAPTEL